MYILKNALKSISRSKGRNILIGIIVMVIAVSSCVALSIKNAASTAESQGMSALNITGQISLDREKLRQSAQSSGSDFRQAMSSYTDLTLDELLKYADSANVKNFIYTLSSSVNASGTLEPYDTSATATATPSTAPSATATPGRNNQFPGGESGSLGGFNIPGGMGTQGDFNIIGYSSEDAMTSFVSGTSSVTSGSMFTFDSADANCLISSELAALNDLEVGSTITLANPNSDTETYTFTVTGIYTNTASTTSSSSTNIMRFSTSMDPANQIYTSYNSLKTLTDASAASATTETDATTGRTNTTALRSQVSGTYVFADASKYEAFKSELTSLGLSTNYTLSSTDITNYEQSLVPLKNLSNFATIFLIIVLAIGGVILIVFNIFNIRERKYEVGVLTAIGMKKKKVALQFITEIFAVTLLAIVLGTAVGAVVSVPTANKLLASQISAQQSQTTQRDQSFGRQRSSSQTQGQPPSFQAGSGFTGIRNQAVSYISDINATISFGVIGELLAIGVLLTILSSLVGIVFIMRYEPLKILSSRT